MEIVTSIGGEIWHAQAQNGVNFDFRVQFDLEGQGQSPPKTIGILTNVFYTYCPNLVILAWTGVELSHGQASAYRTHRWTDGRTHRQTDAGKDNTRRLKLASGKKLSYGSSGGGGGDGVDRLYDDEVKEEGSIPYSKVHGANMGTIWDRQDPGGLHVGPMNFAIWDVEEGEERCSTLS